ncbi:MAG: hypothetical protein ABJ327_01080 [Litoreibacter sp.]
MAIVPNPDQVGGDFIVIDSPSLGQVLRTDFPEEATFLVAHEMAHIINDDFRAARAQLTTRIKEDQADKFAVCAVARLSGSWESLAVFLRNLRDVPSEDYSQFIDVEANLRSEYDRCYVARRGEEATQSPNNIGDIAFYLDLDTEALKGYSTSVSFSPSGDILAAVMVINGDRIVRFFETGSWQTVAVAPIEQGNIFESGFSSDGRYLALAGFLDGVAIYDRMNNWERITINPTRDDVRDFAFVPGVEDTIVTASVDGNACIVNILNPRSMRCFEHSNESDGPIALFSVAVSPDGTEIATGTYGTIYRWTVRNNQSPTAIVDVGQTLVTDLEYAVSEQLLFAAIDQKELVGLPLDETEDRAFFTAQINDSWIQLDSSGDRLFTSYFSDRLTAFSTKLANPVFSLSDDDYIFDSVASFDGGRRVRAIFDFEVSTNNRHLAIAGYALAVLELNE